MTLTMPEEILLLLLDDETGKPVGLPGPAGDLALAGAILMELALAHRLDTDLDGLVLVSAAPMGQPALDGVLARIAAERESRGSRWWIRELAKGVAPLRARLLDGLVAAGVLRRQKDRLLWVFPDHRYPKAPGRAETEGVRARLRGVVLGDEIPEPRDALLIGLCRAAGLVPLLLSAEEAKAAEARILHLARLEEISRALRAAVRDVYAAMTR